MKTNVIKKTGTNTKKTSKNTTHSAYRAKVVEHLLILELLQVAWKNDKCNLEISIPQVDNSGYDLVAEANNKIRHIQLKSSYNYPSKPNIHIKLMDKPSACIIFLLLDRNKEDVKFKRFYFCGDPHGEPIHNFSKDKVSKRTTKGKGGVRPERENFRQISEKFIPFDDIESLYAALFGE